MIGSIRWNLSKKAARFRDADVIIVTLPKSGTTWLRVFLYSYFSMLEKREFTWRRPDYASGKIPKLLFTHDLFEHITEPNLWSWLRGRHLIPPNERHTKSILLTSRDPRDVIVSLYFELSKRSKRRKYSGDIHHMLEHPKFGIKMIVKIMNAWIQEWANRPGFKLLRYEDCRANPEAAFREVLRFLGFKDIDESALSKSLTFSSFDNMKKLEAAGQFKFAITAVNDPESFRVRRGVMGGYKEYLKADEIFKVEEAITFLDPRYGYSQAPPRYFE